MVFFFFKQKTAYELRISDWSSDVCSSDLPVPVGQCDGSHPLSAPPRIAVRRRLAVLRSQRDDLAPRRHEDVHVLSQYLRRGRGQFVERVAGEALLPLRGPFEVDAARQFGSASCGARGGQSV